MTMRKRALVAAFVMGLCGQVFALSLVSTPNGFVANDGTNFGAAAPPSEQTNQPFFSTTPGGLGVTVTSSNGSALINVDPTPTFTRDFLPGSVQVGSSAADTLNVTFGAGIRGVATQITHPHQGPYLSRITAFDAGNNVLGTFDLTGFENNSADGSAIWIGVQDPNPVIRRVTFENFEGTVVVTNPSNQDSVLITDLKLLTGSGTSGPPTGGAVPEPAGLGLLVMGVLGLGWRFRRRV